MKSVFVTLFLSVNSGRNCFIKSAPEVALTDSGPIVDADLERLGNVAFFAPAEVLNLAGADIFEKFLARNPNLLTHRPVCLPRRQAELIQNGLTKLYG
jgi:hypothetical protein